EFLVAILNLSTYLFINDGVKYSIDAFEKLKDAFCLVPWMKLACNYRVNQWVAPAFCELVTCPLNSFSLDDFFHLGPFVFHMLVLTNTKIGTQQGAIVYCSPPLVTDPSCQTLFNCTAAWEYNWWDSVACRLLH
ncbi:hypothetical protein BDQ17DRAFT_1182714, partial [Cyathus striatus]